MLLDLHHVTSRYIDTVTALTASPEFEALDSSEGEMLGVLAGSLHHDLKLQVTSAVTRTQEGFRSLLYILLLRGLVMQVA